MQTTASSDQYEDPVRVNNYSNYKRNVVPSKCQIDEFSNQTPLSMLI